MLRLAMILLIAAPLCAEVATLEDVKALPEGVKAVKCDPGVMDDVLGALAKIETLEELDLYHCRKISPKGLAHLSALKLRVLSLDMCQQLKDPALVEVAKLTTLEELNLHQGIYYTNDGMKPLRALVNLRSINLGMFWDADAEGLEHVLGLPKLEALALRLNGWVSDQALARIVEMRPNLKKLDLRECKAYSQEGLMHVAKLKSLTWLDVGGYKTMSPEMIAEIGKITTLEHLNLIMAGLFKDDALLALEPLKNLKFLGLETLLFVTGECFKTWKPPALEHLELKLNELTNEGLHAVATLKSLKRLYVWNYGNDTADESALGELATLENLEYLSISWDSLSDGTLKKLSKLPRLEELELIGSDALTDEGVSHLASATQLRRFEVLMCKSVSDDALAALRKALPRCEVVRGKDPN